MAIQTENALDANNEYEKLKLILENPRFYLSSFFSDLRTQVDLEFAQKQVNSINNEESHTKLNTNWMQIIQKIDEFESECYKARLANTFAKETYLKFTNRLNQIEDKLKDASNKDNTALLDEIYAIRFRLEQIMFSNRTILFLAKSRFETTHLLAKLNSTCMVGKLVILTNSYVNASEFTRLVLDQSISGSAITNTHLKFDRIIELIEQDLESQINEIELDISLVDLDSKKLDSLAANLLTGLPQCKTVYLSNNKLDFIDEENTFNDLVSLETIWLGRNNLTKLGKNTFRGLVNLKRVNLWQNEIEHLEENTFKDLINLELIDLHSNQIRTCDARLLNGLVNLKEINLSNNKLNAIASNAFIGLINLEMINLSNNLIQCLDEKQFEGLNKLTHIILRCNKLKCIEFKLFKNLNQLVEINLSNNELECLDGDLLQGLTRLKSIELQENRLDDLDAKFFGHGLTCLKFIDVSSNRLKKLFQLNGLVELRELHASFNQLKSLAKNQFLELRNLRVINLSNNELSRIDESVFDNLNELNEINLKLNTQLDLDLIQVMFGHLPIVI